jgi:hypothetical protein
MKKDNIITLNIPSSKSNDGFKMIPRSIFNQINNMLLYRKNDININEKIAIENHHQDIIKYKYYNEFFDILQKDIYELFNTSFFWNCNMDSRVCDFKITSGKNEGLLCGKRIDIKCTNNNGKYRCFDHISKKDYKPKINTKKNKENLCICKIGYKKQFNCNVMKKYGDYCIYHYKEKIKIQNTKSAKDYYNEISLLNNINIEQTNNCKILNKIYNCNIYNKKIVIADKYDINGYKFNNKLICYNINNEAISSEDDSEPEIENLSINTNLEINNSNNIDNNVLIETDDENLDNYEEEAPFVDQRYITNYIEYISDELDKLDNIHNIDKNTWIENIKNSLDYLCCPNPEHVIYKCIYNYIPLELNEFENHLLKKY